MECTEGKIGRIFVIRWEDKDKLPGIKVWKIEEVYSLDYRETAHHKENAVAEFV